MRRGNSNNRYFGWSIFGGSKAARCYKISRIKTHLEGCFNPRPRFKNQNRTWGARSLFLMVGLMESKPPVTSQLQNISKKQLIEEFGRIVCDKPVQDIEAHGQDFVATGESF
jgi:hypothetical protein